MNVLYVDYHVLMIVLGADSHVLMNSNTPNSHVLMILVSGKVTHFWLIQQVFTEFFSAI